MLLPGVLVLVLAVVAAGGQPAPQRPVVLVNVTVLDGTGAPARRDATVVIRGGRIESVGKSGAAVPKDAEVFDGRGISAVVLGGKLLRRTDLDALLAEGEELAARN